MYEDVLIMYKQLIAGLIITMSPLYSMEKSEPVASGTMMVLTQDIARDQIQSRLTFQEISRLKRSSKYYNALYDMICPYWRDQECSTYACNGCPKSYYYCTKMIVYFALTRNERMFKHVWLHHIWLYHRDIRQRNVAGYITKHKKKPESVIEGEKSCFRGSKIRTKDAIRYYRHSFKRPKDVHRHIFNYAKTAIEYENIPLANTILSGSGLNLFKLSKKMFVDDEDIDFMFSDACLLNNTDLIKNMCGGRVDTNSFLYVIRYANDQLLYQLLVQDILPPESATKREKKSLLHHAAKYGFENVIRVALEKGAYVNCRDSHDMTPLHYAVKRARFGVVTELLSCGDVEVRLKDKHGRMAIDYNVPRRKHLLHAPRRSVTRQEIARMLKDHKDQHHVSGYSRSKVHSNGYQALL